MPGLVQNPASVDVIHYHRFIFGLIVPDGVPVHSRVPGLVFDLGDALHGLYHVPLKVLVAEHPATERGYVSAVLSAFELRPVLQLERPEVVVDAVLNDTNTTLANWICTSER